MDRAETVAALYRDIEQADFAYVRGEIDQDKWFEQKRFLNERLVIFGLQIVVRPWEAARNPF